MVYYNIFEFVQSIETEKGLSKAFAGYLAKERVNDEWLDDMLDGHTKEVLAKDLLAGKYEMKNLLIDFIIEGFNSDKDKINETATSLFVSDKKALKQFLDIVNSECQEYKTKYKKQAWFQEANGKKLLDDITIGVNARFKTTQRNTAEVKNNNRLQWNGETAVLCSLLNDLRKLRTDKNNLPFLSASDKELQEFICNNFLNKEGKEIEVSTVERNLSGKDAKRGRLYISKNQL